MFTIASLTNSLHYGKPFHKTTNQNIFKVIYFYVLGANLYKFEGDEPTAKKFWIPVFNNSGRITHFIYVSKLLDDERIPFGSSNSDVDMIQALSSTTAADAPMYLAADNDCLYAIIGDNAYSMSPLAKDGAKLPDIRTSGLDIITIILPLE